MFEHRYDEAPFAKPVVNMKRNKMSKMLKKKTEIEIDQLIVLEILFLRVCRLILFFTIFMLISAPKISTFELYLHYKIYIA